MRAPLDAQLWQDLEQSHWIQDGDPAAPRVLYTFTDPNCPYCVRFWEMARPWVEAGEVQLRHVMVGILQPNSPAKAAALLGADDPAAALHNHSEGESIAPRRSPARSRTRSTATTSCSTPWPCSPPRPPSIATARGWRCCRAFPTPSACTRPWAASSPDEKRPARARWLGRGGYQPVEAAGGVKGKASWMGRDQRAGIARARNQPATMVTSMASSGAVSPATEAMAGPGQ
ncbi:thiol:disulfide interchange protein DsbG [Halomonas sp. E19]|uniref:thiol:disulfide interchange protein DsbG n=1 Tax=Halomonas sp. E19 TaxID=3397247 RepID=UPI0040345381